MLRSIFPRILLVEDDLSISALITAALAAHNVQVDQCDSELAAIKLIATREYNAIVVDVRIVGRVGLTLLAHLHEAIPHMVSRIIVITADDRAEVEAELRAIGICGVIPKPVDLEEIVRAVQDCLDSAAAAIN